MNLDAARRTRFQLGLDRPFWEGLGRCGWKRRRPGSGTDATIRALPSSRGGGPRRSSRPPRYLNSTGTLQAVTKDRVRAVSDTGLCLLVSFDLPSPAGSKHAWHVSTNPVGAISYTVVQVYEAPLAGRTNQFSTTRTDRVFSISQRPNSFADSRTCRLLRLPGNSFYMGRIGWFSRRWRVHQHFSRPSRKQSRDLTRPLEGKEGCSVTAVGGGYTLY